MSSEKRQPSDHEKKSRRTEELLAQAEELLEQLRAEMKKSKKIIKKLSGLRKGKKGGK